MKAEFSYDFYDAMIRRAKERGYTLRRLDDQSARADEKTFYLRHDVDMSPLCAGKLGEIAAAAGTVGTYFFQLNAETYNIFSPETRGVMERLRSLGHCVGLHVDELLVGESGDKINQTLDWFSECCWPVDRAVSFHRPTPSVLGRAYDGFVNAYAPGLWGQECYLSDSRRQLAFWEKLESWLDEGRKSVQLLLHPEWWHPHPDAASMWGDLRARRVLELERYMLRNFSKVFTEAIPASDFRPTV